MWLGPGKPEVLPTVGLLNGSALPLFPLDEDSHDVSHICGPGLHRVPRRSACRSLRHRARHHQQSARRRLWQACVGHGNPPMSPSPPLDLDPGNGSGFALNHNIHFYAVLVPEVKEACRRIRQLACRNNSWNTNVSRSCPSNARSAASEVVSAPSSAAASPESPTCSFGVFTIRLRRLLCHGGSRFSRNSRSRSTT